MLQYNTSWSYLTVFGKQSIDPWQNLYVNQVTAVTWSQYIMFCQRSGKCTRIRNAITNAAFPQCYLSDMAKGALRELPLGVPGTWNQEPTSHMLDLVKLAPWWSTLESNLSLLEIPSNVFLGHLLKNLLSYFPWIRNLHCDQVTAVTCQIKLRYIFWSGNYTVVL